jgi:hypothetical protein
MSEVLDRVTVADMVAMNDGSNVMPVFLAKETGGRGSRGKRLTPRRQRTAR